MKVSQTEIFSTKVILFYIIFFSFTFSHLIKWKNSRNKNKYKVVIFTWFFYFFGIKHNLCHTTGNTVATKIGESVEFGSLDSYLIYISRKDFELIIPSPKKFIICTCSICVVCKSNLFQVHFENTYVKFKFNFK